MTDQAAKEDNRESIPTLRESVVVRWLIGLCMVLFAVDQLLTTQVIDTAGNLRKIGLLTAFGNFNVPEGVNGHQYWRLLTYQFLHGGYIHLGMNMMALYVFGPLIEKWWGPKRFLAFYLLCGACGAWLMAMIAFFPNIINGQNAWLVGASGSIFGVLVASAMLYPKDEVKLIIPPMWVTVRKLAIIFIVLSIGSMFVGYNVGGNAAHVGGAIFGYLLIQRPWSLDFIDPKAPKLDPPSKTDDEDKPLNTDGGGT